MFTSIGKLHRIFIILVNTKQKLNFLLRVLNKLGPQRRCQEVGDSFCPNTQTPKLRAGVRNKQKNPHEVQLCMA